jgi:hypothetical protein
MAYTPEQREIARIALGLENKEDVVAVGDAEKKEQLLLLSFKAAATASGQHIRNPTNHQSHNGQNHPGEQGQDKNKTGDDAKKDSSGGGHVQHPLQRNRSNGGNGSRSPNHIKRPMNV